MKEIKCVTLRVCVCVLRERSNEDLVCDTMCVCVCEREKESEDERV